MLDLLAVLGRRDRLDHGVLRDLLAGLVQPEL